MGIARYGPGVAEVSCGLGQQKAALSYKPGGQKLEVRIRAPSQGTEQDQGSGSKPRSSQSSNTEPGGLLKSVVKEQAKLKPEFKHKPEGLPESEIRKSAKGKPKSKGLGTQSGVPGQKPEKSQYTA